MNDAKSFFIIFAPPLHRTFRSTEKMGKIKNIVFDFGGVIITIDYQQAVKHFQQIGIANAAHVLDPYTQIGIFGDLEKGKISGEEFRQQLSSIAGKELSWNDCKYGWLGYLKELPQRNLNVLRQLHKEGFRLLLLSNTNPFIMEWAMSDQFDGQGHSLKDYFDGICVSYECGVLKPDKAIFQHLLEKENILAEETLFLDDGPKNVAAAVQLGFRTFCPENGADWTKDIYQHLK